MPRVLNDDQYDWIWSNGDEQHFDWIDVQDPRHRLTVAITAQVPVGRGQKFGKEMSKALDLVIGGWQITGAAVFRRRPGAPVRRHAGPEA